MDKARLQKLPLFADLEEGDLEVISTFGVERSVSEGEILVREGDFAYELIAIEEGTAAVEHGGEQVAVLGPGDFFGEIGFMSKQLRAATVRATSPMRVLTLSTWEIKRMRKMPSVMAKIEQTIEARN